MSFVEYLLIGIVTFLVIGSSLTFAAIARAGDGSEDVLGFHPGDRPMLPMRTPAPITPSKVVIALPVANVSATVAGSTNPFVPQTSTESNSTTPMMTTIRREAPISPLYRRHHRSAQSRSPFAAGSVSPFPTTASASPFGAPRIPAGPANSNSPFEVIPRQKT